MIVEGFYMFQMDEILSIEFQIINALTSSIVGTQDRLIYSEINLLYPACHGVL